MEKQDEHENKWKNKEEHGKDKAQQKTTYTCILQSGFQQESNFSNAERGGWAAGGPALRGWGGDPFFFVTSFFFSVFFSSGFFLGKKPEKNQKRTRKKTEKNRKNTAQKLQQTAPPKKNTPQKLPQTAAQKTLGW